MNEPQHPLIVARGLTLRYGNAIAFSGVDLDVLPGRITAILGPSGCGKTSFLQCLNRLGDLVPGCRVTGTLHFGDLDVLDPGIDVVALRRNVGMIFQRPNPFPLSIQHNLDMPLAENGVRPRAERARRIEQVLRDVGLWEEVKDRLATRADALSGGQQQRLCIARALVLEPQVLLMDEPCSALDPIASGVVEDLIVSLRGRVSIVIVTHNLAQAQRIADDAAVFWVSDGAGCVIERGTAAKVLHEPDEAVTRDYVRGHRG